MECSAQHDDKARQHGRDRPVGALSRFINTPPEGDQNQQRCSNAKDKRVNRGEQEPVIDGNNSENDTKIDQWISDYQNQREDV